MSEGSENETAGLHTIGNKEVQIAVLLAKVRLATVYLEPFWYAAPQTRCGLA